MLTAILQGKGDRAFTAGEAKVLGNGASWLSVVTGAPVKLHVPKPKVNVIDPLFQLPIDTFQQKNGAYFSHTGKSPHPPTRPHNPLRTNAFGVLYGLLQRSRRYEFSTDQQTGGVGDFAASDLSVYDSLEEKRTEIFIETGDFNFSDLETTVIRLSSQGKHVMVVLSAYDRIINPKGAYLRKVAEIQKDKLEEKKSKRHNNLYKLKDNEVKLVGWFMNAMTYCKHSAAPQNCILVQANFQRAFLPIIPTEPTDSKLVELVMSDYAEDVKRQHITEVSVKQPFTENRMVHGEWKRFEGVREVNLRVGKGEIRRELTSYRKKPYLDIINELVLMYRTTEGDGLLVAFPTPLRHLEVRREAERPVQMAMF